MLRCGSSPLLTPERSMSSIRRGRSCFAPRLRSRSHGAARLRARVPSAVPGGGDAPQLLLEAAQRLEPLDAALARETYLDAFAAALFADRLTRGSGLREVAEAVLAATRGESSRRSPRA